MTDDNPYGAHVDTEYYLVVTDSKNISYQDLGENFNIDKSYQTINIKSMDKTHIYQINNHGKILKN